MPLRLWTLGSKQEIVHPTSLAILPRGLPRAEAPGYVLSNAYAKTLGISLPRREVLLGLATLMAACAVPLRPARAMPLAAVAIAGVALGAAVIRVLSPTFGLFNAHNADDDRAKGYVEIRVIDLKTDEVEGSLSAFYVFPANTTVTIQFDQGPAATTKGDKILEVAGDDSDDSDDSDNSDNFEAV